jgi:hypothetical protein
LRLIIGDRPARRERQSSRNPCHSIEGRAKHHAMVGKSHIRDVQDELPAGGKRSECEENYSWILQTGQKPCWHAISAAKSHRSRRFNLDQYVKLCTVLAITDLTHLNIQQPESSF